MTPGQPVGWDVQPEFVDQKVVALSTDFEVGDDGGVEFDVVVRSDRGLRAETNSMPISKVSLYAAFVTALNRPYRP